MAEADPAINGLRRETRERMGIETLEVRQSLETPLAIRRTLAANRVVALLVDRHVERDRVEVSLFGRRTWFLQTPALFAYLTGAPIIPCFLERVGPAQFTTIALPPIVVDRTLPRAAAIQQATQQMADALESRIRLKPHPGITSIPTGMPRMRSRRQRSRCRDADGSRFTRRAYTLETVRNFGEVTTSRPSYR